MHKLIYNENNNLLRRQLINMSITLGVAKTFLSKDEVVILIEEEVQESTT